MQVDLSFAKPIGPYSNPINWIPPTYCHVEVSYHTSAAQFRKYLEEAKEIAHAPAELEKLQKRIKNFAGKLIVCFFINWGETVSVRYLSELIDTPYLRPPGPPVYDVVPISMELEQVEKMTMFYLKHVGKKYDYTRAILSLFPFTLRETTLDRFYCAQLVMHSLKAAGMEFDVNMDHVSPLCVYNLLNKIKS